ncbi:MAG: FAD binding domain-containing protein [Deltaproteobacteria bacterium]|nr:FAD binding domain-containing protein [Deltaproteobacteria bacterium]
MRLPHFEFFKPATLEEALTVLSEHKDKAKIIAGGTDLLPRMKKWVQKPEVIVSLNALDKLSTIKAEADSLKVGALTTVQQVAASSLIQDKFPFLAEAAHSVGTLQLRHMGTIGGNICQDSRCWYYDHAYLFGQEVWKTCFKRGGDLCHVVKKGKKCYAVYSSDIAPVLTALDAKVELLGMQGERTVPLANIFSGVGDRVHRIGAEEIMTEIRIPNPPPRSVGIYLKERDRGSIDYPIVGVAALLTVDVNGGTEDVKVILTSVGSSPIKAVKAEDVLKGSQLNEELIDEAANQASKEIHPVSNHNFPARYLRELIKTLVKEACMQTWELAGKGGA